MSRTIKFIVVIILTLISLYTIGSWSEQTVINYFVSIISKSINPTNSTILIADISNKSSQKLPENFKIGISTSAYQIEGAWDADGKTPSTWDTLIHSHPELISDGSNADVASDSYHLFKDDISAVNSIGLQFYRFSISWTRILPNGSAINQNGIDYYNKVIDECLANGIEPVVTMFHWDLPQWLQDLGGLPNEIFIDYFVAYADVLFKNFGHKVKRWITVNEPYNYCIISYGFGIWAPAIKSPGVGDYLCGHHLLIAHAKAYRLYREKYFKMFGGEVGITLESPYYIPKDSSVSDKDHQRALQYRLGWFANPLFGTGGYPHVMIDEINERSKVEGRPFSRLPQMSEEVKKLILGSADFLGMNYYTSSLILINKAERDPREEPSWFSDSGVKESADPTWKQAKTFWLYSVPDGLKSLLNWIKNEYNNPPVFITENGWSDEGQMIDDDRIDYVNSHLLAVAEAVNEDQCNVIAYTLWSLFDSFEWNSGYTLKYGFFHVNYSSPTKEKTPKKSVE
ncbi:CLUMA_CG016473, isoform A [Clunio marinus]|uniref:CLUMA_CG016473, isoform A n=1 Tax=Clunio marinus TaxID=568069 RepID=A0A1J1ITB0_9DIPT|nr:CLUMA_CG016473, isoform A [Clunio marinus]